MTGTNSQGFPAKSTLAPSLPVRGGAICKEARHAAAASVLVLAGAYG